MATKKPKSSSKSSGKGKPKKIAGVFVTPVAPRKKNPPRTAFKPGGPNPHAFKKGESPNPGGKPARADARLSRSLLINLSAHAPNDVTEAMKLPKGASWSACLARRLINLALRGDLEAMRLIAHATGDLHNNVHIFDESITDRPIIEIVFVDGIDGRPTPEFLATHPDFKTEQKALPPFVPVGEVLEDQ